MFLFIIWFHLVDLIILVTLCMAYMYWSWVLCNDFEICIYIYIYISYFLGNYTGFTARGYNFWEKEMFSKIFIFAHSHFLFCAPPGISSWAFISTRSRGKSGCRWYFDGIILTLSYCTNLMLCHCVWIKLNPAHRALLLLDTLSLNLFTFYTSSHFMASSPSRCRPAQLDSES